TTTSALTISGSGFGTTTLRGLSIIGQATSTSNVGYNITTGCYAINGTCVSGGAGGGYTTVQNEGSGLTARTILNFTGAGVDCVDDSGNSRTNCTIASGGGSGGGSWSTTTSQVANQLINYSNNDTDIISIGSSATNTAKYWFDPNIAVAYMSGKLGIGTTSPVATLSASSTSETAAAVIDQRGTGGLLLLQQGGVDKFSVGNSGSLTINVETSDTVKNTSGTGKSTDFDYSGSTFASTTATTGSVTISDGTLSGEGSITSTSTATNSVVGTGGHVILRSDGQYIIIHGGGSTAASVWNGFSSGTMGSTTVSVGAGVGAGAISLKRPDGRYLLVHGGGVTSTSIFDPYGLSATSTLATATPGPALGTAAATGTAAFLRPDGRYVVLSGGTGSCPWGVYDPSTNVFTAGTAPTGCSTAWGAGTHVIERADGTFLIYQGGSSATWIYRFTGGAMVTSAAVGTITTGPTAPVSIQGGAFSIKRQDGTFLTLPGAASQSFIYKPVGTTTTALGAFSGNLGVGPSAGLTDNAAQTMWRQDGKYVLITATTTGSVETADLIDLGTNVPGSSNYVAPTFTNPGGALTFSAGNAGFGMTAFMLPDGRYGIVKGGSTNSIDIYDMNFITGTNRAAEQDSYYETECIEDTNISPDSTLNWTGNTEGSIKIQVRTVVSPASCSTGTYRDIQNSGDLIRSSSDHNRIQVKVKFQRELPKFVDQEWLIRKAGITRYRRVNSDPVIYNITIDNSVALHRTQFDFGAAVSSTTAQDSGPASVNITNDKDRSNALALETGVGYGSTINTSATAGTNRIYNGAFSSASSLAIPTASTTIVMRRPDGKFIIIAGNSTPNAQIYDEATGSTTPNASVPTRFLGTGGFAVKRPDGKFLIVLGGGLGTASSTTNVFDPVTSTFSAGPDLASISGTTGAGWGASAITLTNGKILIMHGGSTAFTSIYDPVNNTMIAGPRPQSSATAVAVVGPGSLWIPRPDGTYLFVPGLQAFTTTTCGALNTITNNFDPYTMVFTFTGSPTLTTGTGPGAFTFQRKDGQWVVMRGGGTATSCISPTSAGAALIYNPKSNLFGSTGVALIQGVGWGAHAIPRPDGTWLIVNGAVSAATSITLTTQIYVEEAGAVSTNGFNNIGAFYNGPAFANATGTNSGTVSFQRSDGKFVLIMGSATSTNGFTRSGTQTQIYDAGWVSSGIYKTEQFDLSPIGTKLNSESTLSWKSNMFATQFGGITAEIRTAPTQSALATSSARDIVSGQLINPGDNDVWAQINFNFRRVFPSYGGILTDVWNGNGGGAMYYPQLNIPTPVLYEYKISKDKDILDLQSDGISVFRVNSAGDLYTQVGGTVNTSGADLAERYTSQEQLDFGDVVSIDPQNNHGVKKTKYQYQPDVLGVVSTDPGFVTGAYTKDSYPIALVGRVPVKVSTENGMISAGDYITAASIPGYAMKATLAGRVLGKALEALDPSKLTDCPASDIYVPGRKCGVIMMFVNLIDYSGRSVDLSMSEWNQMKKDRADALAIETGLSPVITGENSVVTSSVPSRDEQVLEFLAQLKAEREAGVSSQSEIFTDKVSAISQVISPEFIANAVHTNALTTNTISGSEPGSLSMSIVGGKLVIRGVRTTSKAPVAGTIATSTQVANAIGAFDLGSTTEATTTSEIASTTPGITSASSTGLIVVSSFANSIPEDVVVSFDTTGNAFFAGEVVAQKVSTGALDVTGPAVFAGGLQVMDLGNASSTMNILSDTIFFGRPYFTTDTGGSAVVKAGAKEVEVVFDREYIEQPIVTGSMSFNEASTTEEEIQKIFDADIRFIITKKTVNGFTIVLNKKAPSDVSFNWTAFAVKDSKEFTSKTVKVDTEVLQESSIESNIASSTQSNIATTTPVTTGTIGDSNVTTTPPVIHTGNGSEIATSTPPTPQPVEPQASTTSEVLPIPVTTSEEPREDVTEPTLGTTPPEAIPTPESTPEPEPEATPEPITP
ncbi:MAG: hypothetical protein WAX44_03075, partial [Minisyncoccia bacterium]